MTGWTYGTSGPGGGWPGRRPNLNLCHAHFGVFRMSALRRTGMIRPFLASDYTLVAEVARLGEIHEVDQPLFLRRLHLGSTLQAVGSTPSTALAWFAEEGRRARLPRTRMLLETLRTLATGTPPLAIRISSTLAFLGAWCLRRIRVRLGRLRRQLLRGWPTGPAKGNA